MRKKALKNSLSLTLGLLFCAPAFAALSPPEDMVDRQAFEGKLSCILGTYFHFQNLNLGDGMWWSKRGRWDSERPRQVRYLRPAEGNLVLVLCESFRELKSERNLSENVSMDGERLFFVVGLDGSDYRIESRYYKIPREIDDSILTGTVGLIGRLNGRGTFGELILHSKKLLEIFFDGKGTARILAMPELSGKAKAFTIGEFTLPSLEEMRRVGPLKRDLDRLKVPCFESALRELFDEDGIDSGLLTLSPSAATSAEYEGIAIYFDGYEHRFNYLMYFETSSPRIDPVKSWPIHEKPRACFIPLGYPHIKLEALPFAKNGEAILSVLENPLLTERSLIVWIYRLADLAISYKYYDGGALFFFFRDAQDELKFIRLK